MSHRRRSRPNSIGGQFAAHPIDMMESPAWRALSLSARRCLERIEIELAHHGGRDNGKLPVTNRDFAAYVSMGAIKSALAELVALGFVEMTPGYACQNPAYGRSAKFRLLFRTGIGGPPEEHRWRRFKTDAEARAVARLARAQAIRKQRGSAASYTSPDASESEALHRASESEALGAYVNPKHCPPSETEALSTISAEGRSNRPSPPRSRWAAPLAEQALEALDDEALAAVIRRVLPRLERRERARLVPSGGRRYKGRDEEGNNR
jgi:hypothetical protein